VCVCVLEKEIPEKEEMGKDFFPDKEAMEDP
jgi:hypothetical protein